MRAFISLLPVPNSTRERIDQLRADVRRMPMPAPGPWQRQQLRLRNAILTKDPRAFPTWHVIAETMSPPPYARFVRTERQFLKSHDWARWSRALAGSSWFSATNAVHQAYHLCRFETDTSRKIGDFDLVLEFGGGYGEMRRIVERVGFRGRYLIFDLPELNALQRFYFCTNSGQPTATLSNVDAVRTELESEGPNARKLFIATWSLDETPLEMRQCWLNLLASFDAFLIAYQTKFAGIDNRAFFDSWQKQFPRIRWNTYAIPQLKDGFYLFGSS
jgi:hypothetical protein